MAIFFGFFLKCWKRSVVEEGQSDLRRLEMEERTDLAERSKLVNVQG